MNIVAATAVLAGFRGRAEDAHLLLIMACHADRDSGVAWPGVATLADEARRHPTNVRHSLARLVADGWLVVVDESGARVAGDARHGGRTGGRGRKTSYRINLDLLAPGNPSAGARVSDENPSETRAQEHQNPSTEASKPERKPEHGNPEDRLLWPIEPVKGFEGEGKEKIQGIRESRHRDEVVRASTSKPARILLDGPNAEHVAFAKQHGLDVDDLWSRYVDHKASSGRQRFDDVAGFRLWIKGAYDRSPEARKDAEERAAMAEWRALAGDDAELAATAEVRRERNWEREREALAEVERRIDSATTGAELDAALQEYGDDIPADQANRIQARAMARFSEINCVDDRQVRATAPTADDWNLS